MEAVADAPVTDRPESKLLEVDPAKFAALSDSRARVNDALVRFNAANEDMKSKKKIYEAARATFERDFDRFVQNVRGEDLPLFSQSELLDKAKADPIVTKLVDGLLSIGCDVNAIIVAGYSQEERAQAQTYVDAMQTVATQVAGGESSDATIEVPAFLLPQPLTPIELAELAQRLADRAIDCPTDEIAAWSKARLADVEDWLTRCAAIEKEKGAAVTDDDLPAAPEFLLEESRDDDAESDPNVH